MIKKEELLLQKQQYYIDCIERLRGGAIERLSWDSLYLLLDELSEGVPMILHPLQPTDKFARGRVLPNADKFDSVKTLSYPPIQYCNDFGRCNRPKEPVFYSGVGNELIFTEIGAKIGDIVGLLHLSPIKELLFIRLGALELWRRTNGHCLLSENIKSKIKEIYTKPENITAFIFDAFISDYFSQSGSSNVYNLTSAYTSVVLNSHQNISGLIYDSVDHTKGACLAIKSSVFDNKWLTPTEVQIVKITNYLGYGIYDFEQIHFANKFDNDIITWDN